MARLPDASALGQLPSAQSNRPIATYDVSGYGRGAEALAKGGQSLAAGIEKVSVAIGDTLKAEADIEVAKAESQYLVRTRQINNELEAETEPGDLKKKYQPLFEQARDEAAGLISNQRKRELFTLRRNPDVEQLSIRAGTVNDKLVADKDYAGAEQQLGTLMQSAMAEKDELRRAEYVRAGADLIDGLVGRGILTNEKALARKQKWVKEYTAADAMARIDRGEGAQLLQELRESRDAMPKPADASGARPTAAGAGAINTTAENLGIEPGVLAKVISYETKGSFNPNVWGGKGGAYLGLIQFSPENQKRYGVRPGMSFDEQMGAVEAYLKDRGVKPGMGVAEVYSIINAGSLDRDGQPRWNAHDGNGTLREHVARIEREHGAAADKFLGTTRVAAAGTTATDGQASPAPRAPNKYDLLDPLQRETLITRAETALRKQETLDNAAFKGRIEDTRTEAFNTGTVARPVTKDEFVSRMGPDAGAAAFDQYQADLQLGADLQRLGSMSVIEQQELLQSYAPAAGDVNYAARLKRYGEIGKAMQSIETERKKDPADFVIRRMPAAQEGFANLQTALADPTATMAQKQAAARDYVARMDSEQERIGISPEDRRIVPKGYIDSLVKNLENPQLLNNGKGTPLDAARMVENEARLWGNDWPLISRDIQKKTTKPIVRVLAVGVDDQAAMTLPSLADISTGDILKGHPEAKAKEVRDEFGKQLAKFGASLLGSREQVGFIDDYAAAGEKLTAYHVANGKSASEAAKLAFDGLLGHKYEFVEGEFFGPWGSSYGTVRIPKDTGYKLDDITAGANEARQRIDWLDVAPGTTLRSSQAAAREFARDGKWATAAGDRGLWLVLDGQVATRSDGSPLILTWADLAGFAKQGRDRWANEGAAAP